MDYTHWETPLKDAIKETRCLPSSGVNLMEQSSSWAIEDVSSLPLLVPMGPFAHGNYVLGMGS